MANGTLRLRAARGEEVKSFGGENTELRAKLEYYEKKEGEGAQGGQSLPSRRESGMEEEW